jgi:hypothetical protein
MTVVGPPVGQVTAATIRQLSDFVVTTPTALNGCQLSINGANRLCHWQPQLIVT